jgi:hypothetical protein
LLQQSASAVQQALQDTAQQACAEPAGGAAAALGHLFVPAVLFLSAALAASPGVHLHSLACRMYSCYAVLFFACAAHFLSPNQQLSKGGTIYLLQCQHTKWHMFALVTSSFFDRSHIV